MRSVISSIESWTFSSSPTVIFWQCCLKPPYYFHEKMPLINSEGHLTITEVM